jgi:DNA-binding CsgD family transcriptional regulator
VTIDERFHGEIVGRIYEAAALPGLWPGVLQDIADKAGGVGATMVAQDDSGVSITASPRIEAIVSDYVSEGWAADPQYAAPLLADQYPGFRAETDYRSIAEIEALPVHVEFLAPRGLIAGVGTVLQGASGDMLHMAIEGVPSHREAQRAVPWLDRLRPSLARAMSLTARLRDAKAANAIAALEFAGIGAAVISGEGRLRAISDRFTQQLGGGLRDGAGRALFVDRFLQAQITAALAAPSVERGVRSIAIGARDGRPACAVHLLPLQAGARDVFGWDGILLLLAEAANTRVPNADLLRLLFDLTPAEARLTRLLLEGKTVADAALSSRVAQATIRSQLKAVFGKTGVARQSDLVRLLAGLGAPGD